MYREPKYKGEQPLDTHHLEITLELALIGVQSETVEVQPGAAKVLNVIAEVLVLTDTREERDHTLEYDECT